MVFFKIINTQIILLYIRHRYILYKNIKLFVLVYLLNKHKENKMLN